MSFFVYLSNAGRRLQVDLNLISSTESLRTWIADNSNIPAERQILMTAKGKNVRQQHLVPESEIFVYDKNYLTGASVDNAPILERLELPELQEFPSTLADENSLLAWQDLFMSRRAWALQVTEVVKNGVDSIEAILVQAEVFQRCINVALENLRNHLSSLQQSADKTLNWARESLAEQQDVLQEWRDSANTLSELPVREDITRLLRLSDSNGHDIGTSGTMLGMLNNQNLEDAAQALAQGSQSFRVNIETLKASIETVSEDTEKAMKLGHVEWPDFPTDGLLPETEALAKQINKDYQEVLQSSDDPKSISAISRRAVPHTQNFLPVLQDIAREVYGMIDKAIEVRDDLDTRCKQSLRQVSAIQSRFSGLHLQISGLKIDDSGQEGLDTLDKTFRLPVAYGSTLVEAARRSEWNDQMRMEFEALRGDITQQKDAELRRRKKWAATLSGFLIDDTTLTEALIDLTFSTPANKWPYVSREEIFAYIEDLKALGIEEAVEQVTQLSKELEGAVKIRKTKQNAFKNGSVYDAGQSMLRNGDQVRSLQDDKLRLEEKLRTSDSRIRKLEDLLHRQSQLSRAPSGVFTPGSELERQPSFTGPSPVKATGTESRRSSLSLRRLSNQTLDDKAMVHRIVSLEAQINKLQEEAHAERRSSTESRDKMNEAESVKRDLMANFEAQRQEFEDERQLLEDETHKLKVRLDEVEDELDRVLGSRDHQRHTQEQTISDLQLKLDKLRKAMDQELEQVKSSRDNAHHDLGAQRDRTSVLERQIVQLKEERSKLQSQNASITNDLRAMEDLQQEYVTTLQSAHSNLSPSGLAPGDLKRLVSALEIVSEGAAIHSRGLEDTLQLLRTEQDSCKDKIANLEGQVSQLNGALEEAGKVRTALQEEVNQERSKLSSIRTELTDEQSELQRLRDKFAAGETGSDVLRSRLADEEKRVVELSEQTGKSQAQIGNLQEQIATLSKEAEEHKISEARLLIQANGRAERAEELSQKLSQHNDRMFRMLESFGYSITRQDESLVIQRASKVNASTTLSMDNSAPMRRTVSGSAPVTYSADATDSETLHWIDGNDPDQEAEKYSSFLKAISRLDLDVTMETITKRYKDVENLAKKYQKDTRGYRERSHRLQSEAHDKIAYRAFKEGDLALFLPTRNQATRPWAAFNVGAPHYFLREQDTHRLQSRDWLLARISKVEERVVDLSRSLTTNATRNTDGSDGGSTKSVDDENPFELSDGLRWYMIDAVEEKPGAPSTPGLGKSTVAASVVEVKAHMGRKPTSGKDGAVATGSNVNVTKTLHKSLDSRRSSEASRKSGGLGPLKPQTLGTGSVQTTSATAILSSPTLGTEVEGQASNMFASGPSVRPSNEDTKASSSGQVREDAKVFEINENELTTVLSPSSSSSTSAAQSKRQMQLPTIQPALITRLSSHNSDNATSPVRRAQAQAQSQAQAQTQTQTQIQTQNQGASAPAPSSSSTARPWERLFSLEYNR